MSSLARTFSSPFNSKAMQGAKKFMSLQASNAHKALTSEFQDLFKERTVTRKRKKIVNEIIESEKTYQNQVSMLISLFLMPLKVGYILPKKAIENIFGNIEAIHSVNVQLLDLMETEDVATALYKLAPFMKLYSLYANNFELSNKTIEEYEKRNPDFASFKDLQERREEMNGLKLRALLITPIQRIPRYKLLLESLLEKTAPEHPDCQKLRDACAEVSKVATHINECLRQHENFNRMLSIQNSFAGDGAPKILAPGRKFLREGILSKVCDRGGSKDRNFFLFNDMLIYAKKETSGTFVCRGVFPLINCLVEQVMGGTRGPKEGGSLFKINCKGKTLLLYSTSQFNARSWLRDIKDAIGELHINLASLRRGENDPFTPPDAALRRDSKLRRSKGAKELLKKNNPLSPLKISTCTSPRQDSLYPMRNDILPDLAYNTGTNSVLLKNNEPTIFTGCLSSAKRSKPTLRRLNIDDSPPETPNMGKDSRKLRARKRKCDEVKPVNTLMLSNCAGSAKRSKTRSSQKRRLVEDMGVQYKSVSSPGCFGSAKRGRPMEDRFYGNDSLTDAAAAADNMRLDDQPLNHDVNNKTQTAMEIIADKKTMEIYTSPLKTTTSNKVWSLNDDGNENRKRKRASKFQAKNKVSMSRRKKRKISTRRPYDKAANKPQGENDAHDGDGNSKLLFGMQGTFKYTQTTTTTTEQGIVPTPVNDPVQASCIVM